LLKSTLLQLDSTFSERDYGASTFRDFVDKLAQAGLVVLNQSCRSVLVELRGRASGEAVATPDAVVGRGEAGTADVRAAAGDRDTALSGLAPHLPALLAAHEIGIRAAAVGFDWVQVGDVVAKIEEEVAEVRQAVETGGLSDGRTEEEIGDLLFAIANLARKLGVEPESALRQANRKFAERFAEVERRLRARGLKLRDAGLSAIDQEWERVKTDRAATPNR
jgi:ATP diphosphatase